MRAHVPCLRRSSQVYEAADSVPGRAIRLFIPFGPKEEFVEGPFRPNSTPWAGLTKGLPGVLVELCYHDLREGVVSCQTRMREG